MKTDDLIKTLAEDTTVPRPLWRMAGLMTAVGSVAAAILFLLILGVRPDLVEAVGTGMFQLKMTVFSAITIIMAVDYYRLMRPGARQMPFGVIGAAAIMAMAALFQLVTVSQDQWLGLVYSGDWRTCLMSIPFLAICPLIAALAAMRSAAPASPAVAGLAAGGVAAGISASIYATHCPADSPIYFAVWYSLAAVMVLAAGMAAGRMTLRW